MKTIHHHSSVNWFANRLSALIVGVALLGLSGCSSLPTSVFQTTTVSIASPTSSAYTLVLPEGGKLTSVGRPELSPVLTTSKKRFEISLRKHEIDSEFMVVVERSRGVVHEYSVDREARSAEIVVDRDTVKLVLSKD